MLILYKDKVEICKIEGMDGYNCCNQIWSIPEINSSLTNKLYMKSLSRSNKKLL